MIESDDCTSARWMGHGGAGHVEKRWTHYYAIVGAHLRRSSASFIQRTETMNNRPLYSINDGAQ